MEDNNNNILGEVLGSLINNRDGNNNYGGNWMWVIFFVFMMCWGGNGFGGFGNRGFLGAGTNLATQGDVAAATAWGQTQDGIRDVIENTTNNIARLSQDINGVNQNISQLGYNQLVQANATNQQLARTGFDLQTAVMAGNSMLQGAIMAGDNMINNSIRETAGDTKLTFCQGNSALQAIIQGTGNNIQNAIYQTANATQRDIQSMNADSRLGICQATNALQGALNENGNRITNGITGLGFLTQQKGDEIKFELAKSTCDITSNCTANTQKVLDKLCQMEANAQAAKIQELQIANQALMVANQVKDIQTGQIASAGYIINQLRPYPVPAYTVSSPYGTGGTTTPTVTG